MDQRQEERRGGTSMEPFTTWPTTTAPLTPRAASNPQHEPPRTRPSTPPPERIYVYAPREVKCSRFAGERKGTDPNIEDWIKEVRRALVGQPYTAAEQAQWVCALLDGEAKREVTFSLDTDTTSVEAIFSVLLEHFGCDQNYVAIQRQFFHRRQGSTESIREFTQALVALLEQLQQKDSRVVPLPDMVLRDTFIENIYNTRLHQELTQVLRAHPDRTFREIRDTALQWERRQAALSAARPSTTSKTPTIQAQAHVVTADSQATQATSTELQECREALRRQQQQLDLILQRLATPPPPHRPLPLLPIPRAPPRRPPLPFQADGTPICLRCHEPGHLARHCPQLDSRPSPARPPRAFRPPTAPPAEN